MVSNEGFDQLPYKDNMLIDLALAPARTPFRSSPAGDLGAVRHGRTGDRGASRLFLAALAVVHHHRCRAVSPSATSRRQRCSSMISVIAPFGTPVSMAS